MEKYYQRLATKYEGSTKYLTSLELTYFRMLPAPKHNSYLAGRFLLKALYRDHYEPISYCHIETGYQNHKPYILNNPSLCASLSHSGAYAVAALATSTIGIDIEVKQASNRLSKFITTEEELRAARGTSADTPSKVRTLLWCAKEAAYKADSLSAAPWDYTLYRNEEELFIRRAGLKWSISVFTNRNYQFCIAKLI